MAFNSVRGRVCRITKVDACGKGVVGPKSVVVTKGFIKVSYSAVIKDGESIEVIGADGQLAISDQGCPQLKWYTVEISFTGVDPSAKVILTGNEVVTDYAAKDVGMRIGQDVNCNGGFALEVWTDVPGSTCTTSATSRQVTDGVTTAASTTVTSATANFQVGDVGSTISGGSIPAGATIVSRTSATSVVISAAATASATNVSLTVSFAGNSYQQYGYFLLPFVVQGIIGDFSIENAALNMSVKARTEPGSLWGTGPYNVVPTNASQVPGKLLTPFGDTDHLHLQLTTIAPPNVTDGAIALAST